MYLYKEELGKRKSKEGDKEHKVTRANRPPAVPFEAICSSDWIKRIKLTHDIVLLTRERGVVCEHVLCAFEITPHLVGRVKNILSHFTWTEK